MPNSSSRKAMDYCLQYCNLSSDEDYNINCSLFCDDSDWCEVDEHEKNVIKMFQTSFFCVIFLFGVTGNSLVIATFARYRRLRLRSMTDIFLFHLALADLLMLLTAPLQIGWVYSLSKPNSIPNPTSQLDSLCKAMRAGYAINTYSGLLLLACISIDRYMVVARAQDMLRLRSQILRAGMFAAFGVWCLAILISMPEILYARVVEYDEEMFCIMEASGDIKMVTNGATIGVFCVSLLTMVMCYSSVGWVLREGQHTSRRGKRWHRQRTLKLMVALVLIFLTFQLPYTVVLSLKMAGEFCHLVSECITCTLAYTRCCLNPILYALVGVRFRNDVLQLMRDSGCQRGTERWSKTLNSSSISASSPALTMLSVCSPTFAPNEPSYSSNDIVQSMKFYSTEIK